MLEKKIQRISLNIAKFKNLYVARNSINLEYTLYFKNSIRGEIQFNTLVSYFINVYFAF